MKITLKKAATVIGGVAVAGGIAATQQSEPSSVSSTPAPIPVIRLAPERGFRVDEKTSSSSSP